MYNRIRRKIVLARGCFTVLCLGGILTACAVHVSQKQEDTERTADATENVATVVEDTDAPVLISKKNYVRTNDLQNLSVSYFLQVQDASETEETIGDYQKISDLTEMNFDTVQAYLDQISNLTDQELLDAVAESEDVLEGIPEEEGLYRACAKVTDTSGNVAARQILVVYDKTGPEILHDEQEEVLETEDVTAWPTVSIADGQLVDTVDGAVGKSRGTVEITEADPEQHTYTVTITAKDYGGNISTIRYPLTLLQKETTSEETDTSTEKTNGTASGSASGSGSTGNSAASNADTSAGQTESTTETTGSIVVGGTYDEGKAWEVLSIINERRSENGLEALSMNGTLCAAAKVRAVEITESFSHTRLNGTSPSTAITEAGGSFWSMGENIAAGQSSASYVMECWMNSDGHRANILSADYHQVGIACYVDASKPYKYYWVQLFTD